MTDKKVCDRCGRSLYPEIGWYEQKEMKKKKDLKPEWSNPVELCEECDTDWVYFLNHSLNAIHTFLIWLAGVFCGIATYALIRLLTST